MHSENQKYWTEQFVSKLIEYITKRPALYIAYIDNTVNFDKAQKSLDDIPPADVKHVVYCKDCCFAQPYEKDDNWIAYNCTYGRQSELKSKCFGGNSK